MNLQMETRVKECESEPSLTPLTRCVRTAIDREFPQCSGLTPGSDEATDCPMDVIRSRMDRLNEYRLAGYGHLKKELNCRIPCKRY